MTFGVFFSWGINSWTPWWFMLGSPQLISEDFQSILKRERLYQGLISCDQDLSQNMPYQSSSNDNGNSEWITKTLLPHGCFFFFSLIQSHKIVELEETLANLVQPFDFRTKTFPMPILRSSEHESHSLINNIFKKQLFTAMSEYILSK